MVESKAAELRRLRAEYPDMSPLVLLKISMVWHGARLSARALARLQRPDYRFASDEPFEIAFAGRATQRAVMPGGVLLRDATYVYINWGETYDDPYVIDYDAATCEFTLREPAAGTILADGDDAPGDAREGLVDVIGFTPRPALYDFATSSGTPADALADARAQKLILTAYRRCEFWREGRQCRFCALFTRRGQDPEVPCAEIAEVVRAALSEPGRYSQLYISGGSDFDGEPPFSREVARYVRALSAMGQGFSAPFASQLMAPAYDADTLAHLRELAPVSSYSPNLEVWERASLPACARARTPTLVTTSGCAARWTPWTSLVAATCTRSSWAVPSSRARGPSRASTTRWRKTSRRATGLPSAASRASR